MTLKDAKQFLSQIDMSLTKTRDGAYRVNFKGGKEDTAYYTDELDDAVASGNSMREEVEGYDAYLRKRGIDAQSFRRGIRRRRLVRNPFRLSTRRLYKTKSKTGRIAGREYYPTKGEAWEHAMTLEDYEKSAYKRLKKKKAKGIHRVSSRRIYHVEDEDDSFKTKKLAWASKESKKSKKYSKSGGNEGRLVNPRGTTIYGRLMRIEAQKTQKHNCDAACKEADHMYYHDFKRGTKVIGMPDGSLIMRKGK